MAQSVARAGVRREGERPAGMGADVEYYGTGDGTRLPSSARSAPAADARREVQARSGQGSAGAALGAVSGLGFHRPRQLGLIVQGRAGT